MKAFTKLIIVLTLAVLPILLTSCDSELYEQLTSGKSFLELMAESGSSSADDDVVQIDYVVETENGDSKTLYLQLNTCGGKLALSEDVVADAGIPVELTKEGYLFNGWFTAPDMTGEQVIDADGKVINALILTQCDCHECDGNGKIELYAGFSPLEKACTQSESQFDDNTDLPENDVVVYTPEN